MLVFPMDSIKKINTNDKGKPDTLKQYLKRKT